MGGAVRFRRAVVLAATITALSAASGSAATPEAPPLVVEATIPLEHVSGRIDHLAFDPGRQRLIVAELGNGTVDIVDLAAGKQVHRIDGFKEPQGVAYAAPSDTILVASAGDGTVRVFHASDFAALGTIALGDDADNIRIDPTTGDAVVGYGKGGLAIIDPSGPSKRAEIKLPAHPEAFQLDPTGPRIFANLPDASALAVVDRSSGQHVAWPQSGRSGNFPMAISGDGKTLASVFRHPPLLVLFDAATGAARAAASTCGDADDVFFDEKRGRIYISCGEGVADVFAVATAGLTHLGRVTTSSGARTSLFIPALDRLVVAERAGLLGNTAQLVVLRPLP